MWLKEKRSLPQIPWDTQFLISVCFNPVSRDQPSGRFWQRGLLDIYFIISTHTHTQIGKHWENNTEQAKTRKSNQMHNGGVSFFCSSLIKRSGDSRKLWRRAWLHHTLRSLLGRTLPFSMALVGGIKCVKYIMFAFNLLFWVGGVQFLSCLSLCPCVRTCVCVKLKEK